MRRKNIIKNIRNNTGVLLEFEVKLPSFWVTLSFCIMYIYILSEQQEAANIINICLINMEQFKE